MTYAQVRAVGLIGAQGHVVTVEAHVASGLPALVLTGLPDLSLTEARDRVRAAIANSEQEWPQRRITVNLLPAELPKRGSGFDLAIAAVILAAAGQLPMSALARVVLVGELGLDGKVRAVRGVLPMALAAAKFGLNRLIVPDANAAEAVLVPGVDVRGAQTLRQVLDFFRGQGPLPGPPELAAAAESGGPDLVDVVGQQRGRFAIELAAAGEHHLAMFGPPGAGKSMLAVRLPSVLPPLDDDAALEVTAIHSVAGVLPQLASLIRRPPFQAPHHSASAPALVGGGSAIARPGAISLAHRGVLFLDESPEFRPGVLNSLRQPLEEGRITLMRVHGATTYPARFQLVLAANTCPCGASRDSACSCSSVARRRYLGRLSGPLLDRVDLRLRLEPVLPAALLGIGGAAESSAEVRNRVVRARAVAEDRWRGIGVAANAAVPGSVLRAPPFRLPPATTADLSRRVEFGTLSARGFDRCLRVAWTIADLGGRDLPCREDVAEALELRSGLAS